MDEMESNSFNVSCRFLVGHRSMESNHWFYALYNYLTYFRKDNFNIQARKSTGAYHSWTD